MHSLRGDVTQVLKSPAIGDFCGLLPIHRPSDDRQMKTDLDRVSYFARTTARGRRLSFGFLLSDRLSHMYVNGKTWKQGAALRSWILTATLWRGSPIVRPAKAEAASSISTRQMALAAMDTIRFAACGTTESRSPSPASSTPSRSFGRTPGARAWSMSCATRCTRSWNRTMRACPTSYGSIETKSIEREHHGPSPQRNRAPLLAARVRELPL